LSVWRLNVLLDCAHNAEGATALAAALQPIPPRPGGSIVQGKMRDHVAALGPHFDLVVATRSPSERSLAPETLAALVPRGRKRLVEVMATRALRLRVRASLCGAPDGLVVAGSIFLVGAVRARCSTAGGSNGRVRPDAMSAIPSACTR